MKIEPYVKQKDGGLKTPDIYLDQNEFLKLRTAIQTEGKQHEIMVLGLVSYNAEKNRYNIHKLLIPPQTENTGAYVTTDDDAYSAWLMNIPREERQQMRFHLHTHPGTTSPSGTDEATLHATLDNLDDFYIRVISNQQLHFKIDLFEIKNKRVLTDTDIYVDTSQFLLKLSGTGISIMSYKEDKTLNNEFSTKIKKKTYGYGTYPYVGGFYGGYGVNYPEHDAENPYIPKTVRTQQQSIYDEPENKTLTPPQELPKAEPDKKTILENTTFIMLLESAKEKTAQIKTLEKDYSLQTIMYLFLKQSPIRIGYDLKGYLLVRNMPINEFIDAHNKTSIYPSRRLGCILDAEEFKTLKIYTKAKQMKDKAENPFIMTLDDMLEIIDEESLEKYTEIYQTTENEDKDGEKFATFVEKYYQDTKIKSLEKNIDLEDIIEVLQRCTIEIETKNKKVKKAKVITKVNDYLQLRNIGLQYLLFCEDPENQPKGEETNA